MRVERIPFDPVRDRESWLAMRRDNVNASEVATVCGEGAFGSLARLYSEKKGLQPPQVDTKLLRRGRRLEGAVFDSIKDERPEWDVRRAAIYLRAPELRLGATPDGFAIIPGRAMDRIVIQAKVVSRTIFRNRWLDDPENSVENGAATPPPYYVLQVLAEMLLSQAASGILAVLVTSEFDAPLRMFDIEHDPVAEDRILANVEKFWSTYFDPGVMPPFDPQRDERLLKALFPKDKGTTIDLRGDNWARQLVDELRIASATKKAAIETERQIKTELQAKLGDHSYGLLADGRRISWRVQHRRGYTVAATDPRVLKILKARPDDDEED